MRKISNQLQWSHKCCDRGGHPEDIMKHIRHTNPEWGLRDRGQGGGGQEKLPEKGEN